MKHVPLTSEDEAIARKRAPGEIFFRYVLADRASATKMYNAARFSACTGYRAAARHAAASRGVTQFEANAAWDAGRQLAWGVRS